MSSIVIVAVIALSSVPTLDIFWSRCLSYFIMVCCFFFFFKQKTAYEIHCVTGVQTCALPICHVEQLLPHLSPGRQSLVLLRDGAAVAALADWLVQEGWGDSRLEGMESVGGPRERRRAWRAAAASQALAADPACPPLAVAVLAHRGPGLPLVPRPPN